MCKIYIYFFKSSGCECVVVAQPQFLIDLMACFWLQSFPVNPSDSDACAILNKRALPYFSLNQTSESLATTPAVSRNQSAGTAASLFMHSRLSGFIVLLSLIKRTHKARLKQVVFGASQAIPAVSVKRVIC